MHSIESVIASLTEASTFEDAAQVVLRAMMDDVSAELLRSPYADRGRVLRGMAHLRPADGYRGLFVLEDTPPPGGGAEGPGVMPSFLPSATAWRWVSEHRCAVSIDVQLGVAELDKEGMEPIVREASTTPFESKESRLRLLGREATHILVLPLRVPGGEVEGMISLEADCRAAMGKSFVFSQMKRSLRLAADLAAPYLFALPRRRRPATETDELLPVVGASMAPIVEILRVFCQQEETILLSGPTGAGKSRLSRWCHEQSAERGQPFETLDLAAVPEDLQMAELFGWKKGAFTGAVKDTRGAMARAEGGTLFIDEIDKLSLRAQAGLLRVLEQRVYRPLGDGAGDTTANVRFIVGSNQDLRKAVREGHFREDLYYRIHVLPVRVPPLAERKDEISLWASYMLERRRSSARPAHLSPDAERALTAYDWPGNLRQLDNIARRAHALALAEAGPGLTPLVLSARHVQRALAYEGDAGTGSLLEPLLRAAAAFVLEAERRQKEGQKPLDLDHADAFRGLVLGTAMRKVGTVEEALRLLGKVSIVESRNQHKVLKRDMQKVVALAREIDPDAPLPFEGLGDGS